MIIMLTQQRVGLRDCQFLDLSRTNFHLFANTVRVLLKYFWAQVCNRTVVGRAATVRNTKFQRSFKYCCTVH